MAILLISQFCDNRPMPIKKPRNDAAAMPSTDTSKVFKSPTARTRP